MTKIQQPNTNLPDAVPGRGVPERDGPFQPVNVPAPRQAGAFQNEVPFQPMNLPNAENQNYQTFHAPRPGWWARHSRT